MEIKGRGLIKQDRNGVQHEIRQRCKRDAERRLDAMAEEVEKLKDGAKMFKAVALMTRKRAQQLVVEDDKGRLVGNTTESLDIIRSHFNTQFNRPDASPVLPFHGDPRSLQNPITAHEMYSCIKKLNNNNRACGPDGVNAECLKYGGETLAQALAQCLNCMFETHHPIELGQGTVIPLPKPKKKEGTSRKS
eukprot:scpid86149/ scgid17090/ 